MLSPIEKLSRKLNKFFKDIDRSLMEINMRLERLECLKDSPFKNKKVTKRCFLSVKDVADELGVSVGTVRSYLLGYTWDGKNKQYGNYPKLSHYKINGKIFVDTEELDKWIDEFKVQCHHNDECKMALSLLREATRQ